SQRHQFGARRWRFRDMDRRLRLFFLEVGGEGFDELDDRPAVLVGQLVPARHGRAPHTPGDGAEEVATGWQRAFRSDAKLEDGILEVAWPRLHKGRGRTVAISLHPVADDTAAHVDLFSRLDPLWRSRDRQF